MSEGNGSASDCEDSGRIKILAVGDAGCGKTSLNITYAKNSFPEDINSPDIKWEEYDADVILDDKPVPVQLYETPSQDHYSQIRTTTYEGMDVALMCFSIGDPESFVNISSKWYPELRKYTPDMPVVLVGTKCDLRYDDNVVQQLAAKSLEPVSSLEALALCEKIRAYEYCECSAKTGENIPDVFQAAVEAVAEM